MPTTKKQTTRVTNKTPFKKDFAEKQQTSIVDTTTTTATIKAATTTVVSPEKRSINSELSKVSTLQTYHKHIST